MSPVDNWDNVQEGLETVKESQKCIESTLTHIVDSILNVKQELSMISKDQLQSKISVEQDHLLKTNSRNAASTGTVLEAENNQIKDFHKELHQLRSLVQEISESNQEFLKDMQSWHASAFSDESSSMIKKILEFCSYEEPTTAIVATQTDAILQVSHPRLAVQQRPILTSEEPQKEPRREKREEPRRAEPTKYMVESLKVVHYLFLSLCHIYLQKAIMVCPYLMSGKQHQLFQFTRKDLNQMFKTIAQSH